MDAEEEAMTNQEKRRKYCGGCHNDFYNGNNPLGVKECWSLGRAKPVRLKFVHVDQRPPWKQEAEWTLDCCRRDRYISVGPEVNR